MIVKESTSNSAPVKKQSKRQKKLASKMDDKCPLCCDIFEPDDVNFFPCQCGYQVCRFCWHRIRTNENGLCPHCRRQYSEDPANFKPLSPEELAKLKNEKKKKEIQKKKEVAESRKQLANIRVVQKNLIFVHGLPVGIDTQEEKYRRLLQIFKDCGPVIKCVVNNKTNYAGSQVPRASVYVTYQKIEDALRAYKCLPSKIDEYDVKTSLGTTKYCSNFLKNVHCPKQDCMYLHESADEELCFTKEQIHAGDHLAFGDTLYDKLMSHIHSKSSLSKDPITSDQEVEVQPKLNSVQVKDSLNNHCSDFINTPKPNNTSPQQSRLKAFFDRDSLNSSHESEASSIRRGFEIYNYMESVLNKETNGDTNVQQSLSEESTVNNIHGTVKNSEIFIHPKSQDVPRKEMWPDHGSPIGQSNDVHNHQNTNHIPNEYNMLNGVDSASQILSSLSLNHLENGTSNTIRSDTINSIRSESSDDELGFDPIAISMHALEDMIRKQPVQQRETSSTTLNSMWSQRSYVPPVSNVIPSKLNEYQKRKNPPPGFPVNNIQPNQPTVSPSYDSRHNILINEMKPETYHLLRHNILINEMKPENDAYNSPRHNILINEMKPENDIYNSPRHNILINEMKPENSTYSSLRNNVLIARMNPENPNTYSPIRNNVCINRMSPVQNIQNSINPIPVRTNFQGPRYQQGPVTLSGNGMLNGYSTPPVRNFTPQPNPHQAQAQAMQELIARSLSTTSQHIQSQSQNASHAQYARVDPNLSSPSFWNVNQSQQWMHAENSFQGQSMQDFRPGSPVNVRRIQPQLRPLQVATQRFNNPSPYPENAQFMFPNAQHNQLSKEVVHGFP